MHQSPGGLVKTQITGSALKVSDTAHLRWSPRICISNEFPGDADIFSPQATFKNLRFKLFRVYFISKSDYLKIILD